MASLLRDKGMFASFLGISLIYLRYNSLFPPLACCDLEISQVGVWSLKMFKEKANVKRRSYKKGCTGMGKRPCLYQVMFLLFSGSFQELYTTCTYSFTLMLVKSNDISELSTFHFQACGRKLFLKHCQNTELSGRCF